MTTDHQLDAYRHAEIEPLDELYANPLASPDAIAGWRMEGPGACSFPMGRLRMESTGDPDDGQVANLVHWCPEALPDDVRISWTFRPIQEPGLAILFFAAVGHGGRSVLDDRLAPRSGPYDQYYDGDLDTLHVSYFRRRNPSEIRLNVANLRKSNGFHLVCQGADPIPSVPQCDGDYRIAVTKSGPFVRFEIEQLTCWTWLDDGSSYGPVLGGGHIGFRQMAPLIAEYHDLLVERVRVHPG